MTVKDLERLYDYGYWANRRLIEAVSHLTPAQFTRIVAGGYGSVRNTMVHMVSAELGWLDRCGGYRRGPALEPGDYPNVEAVREQCEMVERRMRSFLAGIQDKELRGRISFTNPRGETVSMVLGELMQHAVLHGMYHRGQIALLLGILGVVPTSFDMVLYDAEQDRVYVW